MTTTIRALANLSHRVARKFCRLFNRLTRHAELACVVTVAIPPFLKLEARYKTNVGTPANDNRRRPRRVA